MRVEALSNLELGKALGGISHTTVADWRNGARPRRKAALRLAEYFGVPVDFLLDDAKAFSPEWLGEHIEATVATAHTTAEPGASKTPASLAGFLRAQAQTLRSQATLLDARATELEKPSQGRKR